MKGKEERSNMGMEEGSGLRREKSDRKSKIFTKEKEIAEVCTCTSCIQYRNWSSNEEMGRRQ